MHLLLDIPPEEESSDTPIVSIVIVMLIFIGVVTFVLTRMKRRVPQDLDDA